MATSIDKVLKDQEKRRDAQAQMKQSLLPKKDVKESENIFEAEIKKMPEDTHNKVAWIDQSSTSRGSSTSAPSSPSAMDHMT